MKPLIYIVEDPYYGDTRLGHLPECPQANVYNTAKPRGDLEVFFKDLKLDQNTGKTRRLPLVLSFLHVNNQEAKFAVPLAGATQWPDGATWLGYVALRVCLTGGRVALFSGGGEEGEELSGVTALLQSEGFSKGWHFDFFALDDIDKDHPDLSGIADPDVWRIDVLKKTRMSKSAFQALNALSALDILLQGYLAIWKPQSVFGKDHEAFKAQYHVLEGEQQRSAEEQTRYVAPLDDPRQRLFRPFDTESKPQEVEGDPEGPEHEGWYWFDECLLDVAETSWEELVGTGSALKDKTALAEVWRILRGTCLGKSDGKRVQDSSVYRDQRDFDDLFERTHNEYVSLFEQAQKKNGECAFESFRNNVNHNDIKNEFLYVIGESQYSDIEKRSCNIEAAWALARGETVKADNLEHKLKNVHMAREHWQEALPKVRDLFGSRLEESGFSLTEKGMKLKDELLGREDSVTGVVTRFVDDFDRIGKLPEAERKTWLERFWKAADRLHNALSEMAQRNDQGGPFGGHIVSMQK